MSTFPLPRTPSPSRFHAPFRMKHASLLLVEDHPLLRSGLRQLIQQNPLLAIIGEAEDLDSARAQWLAQQPQLIVLDLHLPDGNGLLLVRELLPRFPQTRILVLSSDATSGTITQAFEAGVHGYVIKSAPLSEMQRALDALRLGHAFLSPEVAAIALRKLRNEPGDTSLSILSPREREMLRGLALGLRTKEVADQMGIQVKTAETFRRRLMQKLKLTSVAELTRYAIRNGIVDP